MHWTPSTAVNIEDAKNSRISCLDTSRYHNLIGTLDAAIRKIIQTELRLFSSEKSQSCSGQQLQLTARPLKPDLVGAEIQPPHLLQEGACAGEPQIGSVCACLCPQVSSTMVLFLRSNVSFLLTKLYALHKKVKVGATAAMNQSWYRSN